MFKPLNLMCMKRKMFTLLSLLAVMLVVGFTSCQKDELVVDKQSLEVKAAVEPDVYDEWNPAGDAEAECAQLGDFMYAFKIDGWDEGNMNGDYLAEFENGHSNTITILNSDGSIFDWSATNSIGAVIVKAGTGANVFLYDPQAFADQELFGWDNKEVSHTTFCWNPDPDDEEECEWVEETAFGGETEGLGSAWWFAFDTEGPASQKIFAGQMEVEGASVEYDAENDVLTIILGEKMRLQPITEETKVHPRTGVVTETVNDEQVKVQGYNDLPGSRPVAGLFTLYKGRELTIYGDGSRYYVIHLDVEVEVCPETEE
jgi:hypothetical protein